MEDITTEINRLAKENHELVTKALDLLKQLSTENSNIDDLFKTTVNTSVPAFQNKQQRHLHNEIASKNQNIWNLQQQINFFNHERTKLYRDIYFLQQQLFSNSNQEQMLVRMNSMESEVKDLKNAVEGKKM